MVPEQHVLYRRCRHVFLWTHKPLPQLITTGCFYHDASQTSEKHRKEGYRADSSQNLSLFVCVCVCVCVCVRVYVVYEDTNLYNDMGMTEVLQFEGVL